MDENDMHESRMSDAILVFASRSGPVAIPEIRSAVVRFLSRYYPEEIACRMLSTLTFNVMYSRDRRRTCVIATCEDSPLSDAVVLDLFARLCQHGGYLRMGSKEYEVSLEGIADNRRVQLLNWHYFWMERFFRKPYSNKDRHLMN